MHFHIGDDGRLPSSHKRFGTTPQEQFGTCRNERYHSAAVDIHIAGPDSFIQPAVGVYFAFRAALTSRSAAAVALASFPGL